MKSELSSKRSLRFESLETRTLLAADLLVPHNFAMPEDCDDSGSVSPLDALVIINQLNSPESAGVLDSTNMLDVDADGLLSPLDALVVINYLNRSSTDGSAGPSDVSLEVRVARLESAIAKDQLPPALNSDQAQELLQTMKSGGHPEIGERFIDGRLHSRVEVEQIENERIANELALAMPEDGDDSGSQSQDTEEHEDTDLAMPEDGDDSGSQSQDTEEHEDTDLAIQVDCDDSGSVSPLDALGTVRK